ncbi:unnamed protein product [Fraxinus pennsylvanica]|uniref:Prolamin-like domain-containing protein n=1 Tax=Fraxinus pennsylvanica TaxID=56036 RepID=A0AAD1Z4V4_9LAMI|nr:unnamed protein product [Fraxinus pennsylvanica]
MTTLRFLFMTLALVAFSAQPALALESQEPPSHAAEPPSHTEYTPTEPYPGFDYFVEMCLHNISIECESEIYNSILLNYSVNDKCCPQLVVMGQRCLEAIYETVVATISDFKKRDGTQIMKRSVETLDRCVLITNIESYSPLPSIE